VKAQNSSVEKSITGIQIGTVGLWGYKESKLTNQIAVRVELGLYTEIQSGVGYFMAPEITIEPRWYYNLNKRAKKGKKTRNNNSNFLTLKTSYRSDAFEISNYKNKRAQNNFFIIPKWGIRRNINKNFNFETGFGIGAEFLEKTNPVVELHLRFGYDF
jgi:hypothetical protein